MNNEPDNSVGVEPGNESNSADPAPYIAPEGKKNGRFALLVSPEGKLLLTGVAMAILYLAYLAVMFIVQPVKAQIYIGLTALELMVGRAGSMAFGYSNFLTHKEVIPLVMLVETIFIFIFYPLFVFSCRQLKVIKPVQNFFDNIHAQAVKRQNFVRKYGLVGLFAFVFFPLWMTGPAIGSVIGYLMEMPVRRNIFAVLSGNYVAVFCWALLLHSLNKQVAQYGSYAVMVLVAAVIIAIMAGQLMARSKNKNNNHKNHSSEDRRINSEDRRQDTQ
jgi:uncharacterized membrane protein